MNTKHTPGPWYFEQDGDGAKRFWDKYICADNGGGRICTMHTPNGGTAEVMANARLIAAAPRLLAALERTLSRLTHYTAEIESCDLLTADELTIDEARAAIAEAEGAGK